MEVKVSRKVRLFLFREGGDFLEIFLLLYVYCFASFVCLIHARIETDSTIESAGNLQGWYALKRELILFCIQDDINS
ncbi:hypothetical protein N752_01200 [Desulforamulus aquiferis]|nr:hypothetical protein N752_01200 [Desulforamulus aquiferis]